MSQGGNIGRELAYFAPHVRVAPCGKRRGYCDSSTITRAFDCHSDHALHAHKSRFKTLRRRKTSRPLQQKCDNLHHNAAGASKTVTLASPKLQCSKDLIFGGVAERLKAAVLKRSGPTGARGESQRLARHSDKRCLVTSKIQSSRSTCDCRWAQNRERIRSPARAPPGSVFIDPTVIATSPIRATRSRYSNSGLKSGNRVESTLKQSHFPASLGINQDVFRFWTLEKPCTPEPDPRSGERGNHEGHVPRALTATVQPTHDLKSDPSLGQRLTETVDVT